MNGPITPIDPSDKKPQKKKPTMKPIYEKKWDNEEDEVARIAEKEQQRKGK